MEHTYSYNIQDLIIKNPFGQFDILIFNPEFIKYNIFEVKFNLQDNQGIVYELIDNLDYSIYNSSLLFKGKTKSDTNIFSVQDIPLSYVKYHPIYMVIHNINLELKNNLVDKNLIFKWTESIAYPQLNPDDSHPDVEIQWNIGIESDGFEYRLRIIQNHTGMNRKIYRQINEEYIKSSTELYVYNDSNKYLAFNINHLDEHNNYKPDAFANFDYYSGSNLLEELLRENSTRHIDDPMHKGVISETCKITPTKYIELEQNNNLFRYRTRTTLCFSYLDGLTNIKLICDNTKYLVKKINLHMIRTQKVNNQIIQYESVDELEVKSEPYGYKVAGLDNYLVIITLCSLRTDIEIELDTGEKMFNKELDDLAIIFNRMVFDQPIRRNLGKNLDYVEECYITDITDYYKLN